jgi:hypothetical protein
VDVNNQPRVESLAVWKTCPAFFLTPHDLYHRMLSLEETGSAAGGMDAQ